MNELVKQSSAELVSVLQRSQYAGASAESVNLVLGYCQAIGIDPMQKPVQIVPMWDSKTKQTRDVIMPGIGLYRIQAARTGQFAGMAEPVFGPMVVTKLDGRDFEHPEWCVITVNRKLAGGDVVAFAAKEYWIENYAPKGGADKSKWPNAMWERRKFGQLAKCAEAQALRKAFPEVGAAPTDDEYQQAEEHPQERARVVEALPVALPVALPAYAQSDFDKNLPAWSKTMQAGKKTAEGVIATVATRYTLTSEQKSAIRAAATSSESAAFAEFRDALATCENETLKNKLLDDARGQVTEAEYLALCEIVNGTKP